MGAGLSFRIEVEWARDSLGLFGKSSRLLIQYHAAALHIGYVAEHSML